VKLVVDAGVAIGASANPLGFQRFRRYELVAPPLMWIEAVSVLHAMLWRGELRRDQIKPMRDRVLAAPIARTELKALPIEAWRVADEMGWAKTYDANYVALARLLDCRLITLDGRLRRGTARLGFVIGPTELD
jgi:predicted nucleic acid-binding protein